MYYLSEKYILANLDKVLNISPHPVEDRISGINRRAYTRKVTLMGTDFLRTSRREGE